MIIAGLGDYYFFASPPPVSAQPVELAYDDGVSERWWSKDERGVGDYDAVRFSPPVEFSHIVTVKYFISSPGTFNVLILDSDRSLIFEKPATPKIAGWFSVDVSNESIMVRGEFYAAMMWTVAKSP